jgi:hypothetical protein
VKVPSPPVDVLKAAFVLLFTATIGTFGITAPEESWIKPVKAPVIIP